jgi:hypothetical protein
MAVAFDAKATSDVVDASNTSPATLSNMTVGAAATLLIAAACCGDGTTAAVPTGMTWNGVAMTLVSHIAAASGTPTNVYIFALVNPATGNKTLSCSYTADAGTGPTIYLDCWSFSGTDTSSVANAVPAASVQTTQQSPSGSVFPNAAWSITTVSGDAVCAVMNCALASFSTVVAGSTLIRNDSSSTTGNYSSGFRLATTTTTTIQFSSGVGADPAEGIAFRIQQPQAGNSPVIPYDMSDGPWRVSPALSDSSRGLNLELFKNPIPNGPYDYSCPSTRVPRAGFDLSRPLNPNIFKNPIPFNTSASINVPEALFPDTASSIVPPQSYNLSLYGTLTLPFAQYDWSKTLQPPPRAPDQVYPNWAMLFSQPFAQYDWNRPFVPAPERPDPARGLNINLFTNPIPFAQYDWSKPFQIPPELPAPTRALNLQLFQNPLPIFNFIAQQAPPAFPPGPAQPYNQALYTVVVLGTPFAQYDWSKPALPQLGSIYGSVQGSFSALFTATQPQTVTLMGQTWM